MARVRNTDVSKTSDDSMKRPAERPAATSAIAAAGGKTTWGSYDSPATPTRTTPETVVKFGPNWREDVRGDLRPGSKLTIEYDPSRASLRDARDGVPTWGVTAFVKMVPSGRVIEAPAVQFESAHGRATDKARPKPVEVMIPDGATEVQVWFKNWTGNAHEVWDSKYGQNYRFQVRR